MSCSFCATSTVAVATKSGYLSFSGVIHSSHPVDLSSSHHSDFLLSVPPRHALLFFLFLILLSLPLLNLSTTPPAAAALSSHHASILPSLLFRPVKVEPPVWRPRRRPFPLCPCCSPAEGNVTQARLPWPSLRPLESLRPRIFLPYFLTLLCLRFFCWCACV